MTKENWVKHIEDQAGHYPINKDDVVAHKAASPNCPVCKARARTRAASSRAKTIREIYTDLGMHRVKGALGGTYYE